MDGFLISLLFFSQGKVDRRRSRKIPTVKVRKNTQVGGSFYIQVFILVFIKLHFKICLQLPQAEISSLTGVFPTVCVETQPGFHTSKQLDLILHWCLPKKKKRQWRQSKKLETSQGPESRLLNVVQTGLIVGKVLQAWRECDLNTDKRTKTFYMNIWRRPQPGNQLIASNMSSSNTTNQANLFLKQYIWYLKVSPTCLCDFLA